MLAVGIHPDIRMDGYFHLAGRRPCVLPYTQGPVALSVYGGGIWEPIMRFGASLGKVKPFSR